jgi:hypothetical protein
MIARVFFPAPFPFFKTDGRLSGDIFAITFVFPGGQGRIGTYQSESPSDQIMRYFVSDNAAQRPLIIDRAVAKNQIAVRIDDTDPDIADGRHRIGDFASRASAASKTPFIFSPRGSRAYTLKFLCEISCANRN